MLSLRKLILIVLIVFLIISTYLILVRNKVKLKVFHAGSLLLAMEEIEETYEINNPSIDLVRETSGSVEAVRKISELHKTCDLVVAADYRVIEEYLMPNYTNWVIVFCSNEVVLCYTDNSKYSDEINEDNWYRILMKPDVKYGFSNPNMDPCGYRALSILYMASLYYGMPELWNLTVYKHILNVEVVINGSGHYIFFPFKMNYISGGNLVLRDKSVDLVQLLEAGVLDYAFEYRNVAVEHGLKFIELPEALNLAHNPYVNVFVVVFSGDVERMKIIKIGRIRYGLTIPKTCQNYGEAVKLVKWILYGEGKTILEKHGFVIIPYEYRGSVPSELKG
ncbi:MAG: tungstate ABC transporter substrate-binding protein WtpA [Thermofilum sp. ex4484_79]|nr:MAG: tungstate ABC transporter substrate-binding protein WtpA [Thermofilum sp. ex4484_79]